MRTTNDGTDDTQEKGPAEPRSLLPAHALGATDRSEAAAVRALVAVDTEAAAELAGYAALADALLFAAAPVAPPPTLEARLRASLTVAPRPDAARTSRQLWLARWFSPPTWPAWGVAAAAVALLLVSNVWWMLSLRETRRELSGYAQQVAATAAEKSAMMDLMGSDTMTKTMLPAAGLDGAAPLAPDARAELYWDPAQSVALVMAEEFPPLGAEQVYQLWLVRGEERMSGGLFTVDANGRGSLMVHSPKPLEMFDAVGITPEPMGGSPGPTAPPVVRGSL